MNPYKSVVVGSGTRLQSGIPKRSSQGIGDGTGMLLRGVVTATYVLDDPTHPFAEATDTVPVAVYCDVLTYGRQWRFIPNALVSQERSGLHSGHIWKPRACSMNITGTPMDLDRGTPPSLLDGDHVLVSFIDGNTNLPIILRALPHPSADVGNEDKETGHRLKLALADGNPDFWKHNGSFFGVDNSGNFIADTTHANDGTLQSDGKEQLPSTSGLGNQYYDLPQDAEHLVSLNDVSDPKTLTPVTTMQLAKALREIILGDPAAFWNLLIDGGSTAKIEGKDASAKFTLGDGTKSAIIAEAWETFFDTTFKTWITTHTHPTGVGPSGVPVQSGGFPAYSAAAATSTKLLFPDA